VRDREPETPLWGDTGSRIFTAQLFKANTPIPEPHTALTLPATGIAKLTSSDLEVLEGFFSRRLDMTMATRQALAGRIGAAIQAKSGLEVPEAPAWRHFWRLRRANYETRVECNRAISSLGNIRRPLFLNLRERLLIEKNQSGKNDLGKAIFEGMLRLWLKPPVAPS